MSQTLAQVRARVARSVHDALVDLTQVRAEDVKALPTGSFLLDQATGVGGYPIGRIIELFGPESCGKSTSALQAIAAAQDPKRNPFGRGETCMYIDYEHDFDISYAKALGVNIDPDWLVYVQPATFEEGMTCALPFMQEGLVRVIVIDSVAAMLPADDQPALAKDKPSVGEAKQPMTQARLMGQMLRQIRPICSQHGIVMIFLNQTSEVINMNAYGPRLRYKKITTPGGRRLKFFSALRIEFQPIGGIKGTVRDLTTGASVDQVVATRIRATVVKNKVAVPFRKAEFIIRYGVGIDDVMSIVNSAICRGLVMKNRAVYTLHHALSDGPEQKVIHGVNSIIEYFRQTPDKFDILKRGIQNLINAENQTAMQVETELSEEDGDPKDGEEN